MPIGPWELAIILVIVIIIFGAGKLPEIGGALGRGIREFKESARDEDEEEEQQQEEQQQQYGQQQYGQQYPQQQYAQQPQAPPPAEPQYHSDPNAAPQQAQPGEQQGSGSGEPARRDA
ncbi:MAG: twin-arginine translocase TatA/TatE family subunit [Sphaerobacteraceae bacterium]|nr:MAG: twin-arginine translocase TatA/TatE family subunit [Sphaerobacteraceae bacterium]